MPAIDLADGHVAGTANGFLYRFLLPKGKGAYSNPRCREGRYRSRPEVGLKDVEMLEEDIHQVGRTEIHDLSDEKYGRLRRFGRGKECAEVGVRGHDDPIIRNARLMIVVSGALAASRSRTCTAS